MLQMVVTFGILGVMFYFLLIRPQQKQRKDQENLIKNVKTGDKVLLNSGIFGIVSNVKEKSLMIKIADNVKVEVLKSAVGSVVQKSAETEAPAPSPK
jgi:preprotein translocase subunit YajC